MTLLRALRLSRPVSEHFEQPGTVLGSGARAIYVAHGQFVATVTARGVPMMPNGIAVNAVRLPPVAHGARTYCDGALVVGDVRI